MKSLIKVFLVVATCFAATFVIIKVAGLLSVGQIEGWLQQAREMSPIYVGTTIALLLFSDLFVAVPTLTITILAGYFLGFTYGFMAALTGVIFAGTCGYALSRYYGDAILGFLIKDEVKRHDAIDFFQQHGFVTILLSRAMPILPEASACLAGMTKMSFSRFILAWLLSSVPYSLIAVYAGSISSIDNPTPAIITAIGITALLWSAWFLYHHRRQ